VFLLAAGIACFDVRAAPLPLQFDVFLGYDGVIADRSWVPVTCEIKNDGPAFDGTIEVSSTMRGDVIRLSLELPKGTLKRVTIPVFSAQGGYVSWNVRLLDRRRNVLAEHRDVRPRHCVSRNVPVLGSLSRTTTGTPTIQRTKNQDNQAQPMAARILPQLFPDNPLVLEGLTAIYLNSERIADLKPAESEALKRWLFQGGHLLLAFEQPQDLEVSPWLRNLVPFRPEGVRGVSDHSALHAWITGSWPARRSVSSPSQIRQPSSRKKAPPVISELETQPFKSLAVDGAFAASELRVITGNVRGGEVLVREGDTPLIVSSRAGLGKVTVLLFSPEREPVRSWKHLPVFWAKLSGVPAECYSSSDFNRNSMWNSDSAIGAMLETIQVRKLPMAALLLMLLGYIAVIGPGDYLLVRRLKRPMLTWVTFPIHVAVFCGIIYIVGFRLRAGDVEWNQVNVVDVFSGESGNSLRGRSFGSLYSPANSVYRFKGPPGQAAFRGEHGGMYRGGSEQRILVSRQGESYRAQADVPVWSSQLFVSDWFAEGQAPFTLRASGTAENLKLFCENRAGAHISVVCVVSNSILNAGEVAKSEKRTFELRRDSGIALDAAKESTEERIRTAIRNRQMAFGRSTGSERLNDWMFIVELLSFGGDADLSDYQRIESNLDISPVLHDPGAVVVFISAPVAPPASKIIDFKPNRGRQVTVWRMVLPLETQSDGSL